MTDLRRLIRAWNLIREMLDYLAGALTS